MDLEIGVVESGFHLSVDHFLGFLVVGWISVALWMSTGLADFGVW